MRLFRDFIERMAAVKPPGLGRLIFFLNTPGGSAEAAEKMVEIVRHHYQELYFVVPDVAFSAGTILTMAGDRIYMDYSSSLGPIDPQVWNGKEWVPALGYLDKVEALLDKAANGSISNAEFLILQNQDLALLARYEQAIERSGRVGTAATVLFGHAIGGYREDQGVRPPSARHGWPRWQQHSAAGPRDSAQPLIRPPRAPLRLCSSGDQDRLAPAQHGIPAGSCSIARVFDIGWQS